MADTEVLMSQNGHQYGLLIASRPVECINFVTKDLLSTRDCLHTVSWLNGVLALTNHMRPSVMNE